MADNHLPTQMSIEPPVPSQDVVEHLERQEIVSLTYELVKAYKFMVDVYRENASVSDSEDVAAFLAPGARVDLANTCAPQDLEWYQLEVIQRQDPQAMLKRWNGIKQAALDELQSGHLAAMTITSAVGDDRPWERAQFLAIRNSLIQGWGPRDGVELMLVDTMAQAQHMYLHWLEVLTLYSTCEKSERKTKLERNGAWEPPKVSDYQAMEQASSMVDRFNRLFLRTLRQLRDLRRYASQVTMIQSAGQVNIGGQQVNIESGQ